MKPCAAIVAVFAASAATPLVAATPPGRVKSGPERDTVVKLVARSAGTDHEPRLENAREVVAAVMVRMMDSGVVADGTVFAGVSVGADGRVVMLHDFYGAPYSANTQLQRWLTEATARARFALPPRWRAANGGSGWVVFWTFQTNACRPWTYDAPPRATVIRVCLDVTDGRVRPAFSSYVVDMDLREEPASPAPVFASSRVPSYSGAAGERGVTGEVSLRLTLDAKGRVVARETLASTFGDAYEYYLASWQATAKFDIPPEWPKPGRARTLDVRIAFEIVPPGGGECGWVVPMVEGAEIRICVQRVLDR